MEKYSFTFRPSEDAKKVNTAQLAARLNERSEFQQYLGACPVRDGTRSNGACPEEPLLITI